MKNSERSNSSKRKDGLDLISKMPDAILLMILSYLESTEEVIRTSILSRRWRFLWTEVPSLDLDVSNGGKFNTSDFKKSEFKEFVYWVLVNKSVDLDYLRLSCSFYYSISTVGRWIHAAVRRNIKQLYLMFSPKENTTDVEIEIPHCLVTCGSLEILILNLRYCGLKLPNLVGFPALRVLSLVYVDLLGDCDLVKGFLERCPLLDDLTLLDCVLFKLDRLCISSPNLTKLSILNLDGFDEGQSGDIKICCPKLMDLDLKGLIAHNLFFERLESLNKAEIEPKLMGNINSLLFPGISHVESLLIDLYFFSQCIYAAHDPSLPNLKTLVLTSLNDDFTMDDFNRILKYYPKVESLNLIIKKVFDGPEYCKLGDAEIRRLMTPDVNRVEFVEFKGECPKLVINEDEDSSFVEMVFSWGNKAKYFEYRL